MLLFIKSDLFLRFLGGFAVGAAAMFLMAPKEQPMFSGTAVASTVTATDDAAL